MIKKLLILNAFLLITAFLFGQDLNFANHFKYDNHQPISDFDKPLKGHRKSTAAAGCGSVIYSFDFDAGFPTGWSNFGSPSAALWEYRGPNTTPDITIGSRGAYVGVRGPIASSSASNGFIIFDSDFLDSNGDPNTMGLGAAPAPHVGTLLTSALDFSAYPSVSISLESYARTFYGQQWLIFSTDGGITFTDSIQLHSDLEVNEASDNAVSYTFNISNIVGGQSNVLMGFFFDGTPGNANGNGYYFWMVDDVAFIETPDFDISIADWTVNQGSKFGKYGVTPLNETDMYNYSVLVENKGNKDYNSVSFDTETFDINGSLHTSNTTSGLLATFNTVQIDETTGYIPIDTGTYNVNLHISGDSTDCEPLNNVANYSFKVSSENELYTLDHGITSGYLGTNSFTGAEDGFQMLNIFEFRDTFFLKNVWIALSDLTTEGATGYVVVYDSTGATFGGGGQFANQSSPLFKSIEYAFTDLDGENGFASIPCNFKIPPGGYYIGIETYTNGGIDTVRIAEDRSISQNPRASLVYILNTGLYTNPEAFLIRLNQTNCTGVNISINGVVDESSTVGSITQVTINGGEPPYAIQWTGPNLFSSQAQNLNTILRQGNYTITAVDKNGCSGTNSFSVFGLVNLQENLNQASVQVFPNPSEGNFQLNFEKTTSLSGQIEVRTTFGQTVYFLNFKLNDNRNISIDLSHLAKGNYFISIVSEDLNVTENIIIH